MRASTKKLIAAVGTATVYFLGSAFADWGFDPSTWTFGGRTTWVIFLVVFVALAAAAPLEDDGR